MNKNTFRYVLLLMALSAVAAVLFQISWFKDSLQLTNRNFEENVQLAMTSSINKIYEATKNRSITIDENVVTGWNYSSADSLYNYRFYSVFRNNPPNYSPQFYDQLELLNKEFIDIRLNDSLLEENVTIVHSQHNSMKKSPFERFNIDSLLTSNLRKNNIDLKFSYGFYNEIDAVFEITGGDNITDTLAFKKTQFIVQEEDYPALYLQLYDSGTYIYKALIVNILGSILFMIIVLFSLFYAFRIILKQKKLSQIKTDFINNMTHELKTPLATISMATATIEEPDIIKNPESIKQFTKVIKEENTRMNKQIEMVLNVAEEDETLAQLNKRTIDINDVIEPIVANNAIRVKRVNGTITYHPIAANTIIKGDDMHIYQAINNLVDNAIKYSKDTIVITITTENKNGSLIIDVTDMGIGIAKQDEDLIFEKFYRVSTKDRHNVKGFGLGLNYVKKIIVAHQGRIHLKRNVIGTTFFIELPLKEG